MKINPSHPIVKSSFFNEPFSNARSPAIKETQVVKNKNPFIEIKPSLIDPAPAVNKSPATNKNKVPFDQKNAFLQAVVEDLDDLNDDDFAQMDLNKMVSFNPAGKIQPKVAKKSLQADTKISKSKNLIEVPEEEKLETSQHKSRESSLSSQSISSDKLNMLKQPDLSKLVSFGVKLDNFEFAHDDKLEVKPGPKK